MCEKIEREEAKRFYVLILKNKNFTSLVIHIVTDWPLTTEHSWSEIYIMRKVTIPKKVHLHKKCDGATGTILKFFFRQNTQHWNKAFDVSVMIS